MMNWEIMENYEEKYKKALSYVKGLIEHNVVSQENASKYFSELAESEDEKIRKGLIRQFTTLGPSWDKWGGMKRKDILTWLEMYIVAFRHIDNFACVEIACLACRTCLYAERTEALELYGFAIVHAITDTTESIVYNISYLFFLLACLAANFSNQFSFIHIVILLMLKCFSFSNAKIRF